jgi:hypothetical protein
MRSCRVTKPPPSRRRQVLAARVLSKGLLAEMPCSACATSGSLCLFSPHSIKCADCVRRGVRCDGNFSADDFDRLTAEQRKLEIARDAILERLPQETDRIARETREALRRVDRETQEALSLGRRIEALKAAKGKMIERESRSLAELDLEEERQAQQANVALDSVFDEQQLAAFFGPPEGSGSGGGNPQGSQG